MILQLVLGSCLLQIILNAVNRWIHMVDSLGRLLGQIRCLNSIPLATEIIHGLDVPFEVGQCWVPHRQGSAVENLGTADILQGLTFQREMEGELQHFPVIGMG